MFDKKYVVKNKDTNQYAGKHGGWTTKADAKRFLRLDTADRVADALSILSLCDCRAEEDD